MQFFAAVNIPCTVQQAATRYHIDQLVRCDLTNEQVFKLFHDMPEVMLFSNAEAAIDFANLQYYKTLKRNSKTGLFPDNPVKKSNDAELLAIYGADSVFMREKYSLTVIFQLQADEALISRSENAKGADEIYTRYKVTGQDKDSLVIDYAGVPGIVVFFTEEGAKKLGKARTVELTDHREMSVKHQSCNIL